jgi:N-methylhydantoinase B
MEVSSVCPEATDIRQEGMLIPPVKLVEAGRPRSDLWNMITGMSRLPHNMSLDLKALIGANNVAKQHLAALIAQYGVETLRAAMEGLIAYSESRVRRRLRELPDGVTRAVNFKDHDGQANRLYRIAVTMTKQGEELTFDYSESAPQSARFINCTEAGLKGGVYSAVLPVLAHDLPWNAGVLRVLRVVAPPGLIVNAAWPAPVSLGAVGSIWLVELTALEALSKLVACAPGLAAEAQAAPPGAPDIMRVSGLDQYGELFGSPMLDQSFAGEGAYGHRDGLAARGMHCVPQQHLPNVERIEGALPLLYLYRRYQPDTGGPGRRRGGLSATIAYAVHDTRGLMVIPGGHGFEVPNSLGLFGAYPGACNRRLWLRETNFPAILQAGRWPRDVRELGGQEQPLSAQPGRQSFGPNDAYEISPETGGGWGDPTGREPEAVAADVAVGAVSRAVAAAIYGVVLTEAGAVDGAATARRRAEIRAERRARPRARTWEDAPEARGPARWRLGEGLEVVEAGGALVTRCQCGAVLAPADENWKHYATTAVVPESALGPFIRLHADLEAREYACPSCGLLLGIEVATHEAPPLWDIQLTEGARG